MKSLKDAHVLGVYKILYNSTRVQTCFTRCRWKIDFTTFLYKIIIVYTLRLAQISWVIILRYNCTTCSALLCGTKAALACANVNCNHSCSKVDFQLIARSRVNLICGNWVAVASWKNISLTFSLTHCVRHHHELFYTIATSKSALGVFVRIKINLVEDLLDRSHRSSRREYRQLTMTIFRLITEIDLLSHEIGSQTDGFESRHN